MSNPIVSNSELILKSLFDYAQDHPEEIAADGMELMVLSGLEPNDINDSIDYLEDRGPIERVNWKGTKPYNFGQVEINSKGKFIYHELSTGHNIHDNSETKEFNSNLLKQQPVAAGSPFGFTEQDWEYIYLKNQNRNILNVVLGYQFESGFYNSELLTKNLKGQFKKAVDKYNNRGGRESIQLDFKPLAAGYGEHLFNQIARDIISSDIAVFETSDQNANVMIEMGVALTWGVRVLPIRQLNSSKSPSDISGQTWVEYENNGQKFDNNSHEKEFSSMVERAILRKV